MGGATLDVGMCDHDRREDVSVLCERLRAMASRLCAGGPPLYRAILSLFACSKRNTSSSERRRTQRFHQRLGRVVTVASNFPSTVSAPHMTRSWEWRRKSSSNSKGLSF